MENIFVEFLPPWIETGLQPAFYDKESGTVLQQTARMYARVNMLIRMFNKLSKNTKTTVEDYINQFNELHDYVHDYFDNLDVQEEINNKLDAMAEAGTLQEIITSYIQSNVAWTFDNVAGMKVANNLVAGSYAQTLGYQSANDGGDALYKIREANPGETADEKFIVAITGTTLVAELIIEDKTINVLTIGAGVSGQFSATVNYAIAKSNYKVYVPKGSYTAEATINLGTNNTIFECDGNVSCNGVSPLFLVTLFRNVIRINGRCFGNNATDSIFMQVGDDTHAAMYHDIYFHTANDFDYGVVYRTGNGEGISYNTLSFDFINCNKVGILLQTSDTGVSYVTENVFNGGRIAGKGSEECIGIQTIKGANQRDEFNGNTFNHIAIDGNSSDDKLKHFIKLEFAYKNSFNHMRLFEGLGNSYAIVLRSSAENYFSAKYAFDVSMISDDSDSDIMRNYFENGLKNGASYRTNTKFFTQFGGFVIEKDFAQNSNLSNLSAYNTTTFSLPDTYVIGGTTVRVGSDDLSGTVTYTLPKQFNKRCVNRFILFVTYKAKDVSFVINDSSNNEIVTVPATAAALSRKSYMIEYTGNATDVNTKNWKVIPLDYNFA